MPLVRKPPSDKTASSSAGPNLDAVLRGLGAGSDDERWSAARAAADHPASVPALAAALARERSPVVREAMFSALARIASPESIEAVLPYLRSDDALLRTHASDALLAMKGAVWPYVRGLLHDANADVRILACNVVREMPLETAARLCAERLDAEPDANVCAAIVDVLAEIGGPAELPALTRCAQRLGATPFLAFTLKIAIDRIRSQAPNSRAP